MAVSLNHTIVPCRSAKSTAAWYAEMFGLEAPVHWGPFWQVTTANGVALDFDEGDTGENMRSIHYAFLVSEEEFDSVFERIRERAIAFYADPMARRPGEVNRNDGGRGVYFSDPNGHWLEIITRPYGGA